MKSLDAHFLVRAFESLQVQTRKLRVIEPAVGLVSMQRKVSFPLRTWENNCLRVCRSSVLMCADILSEPIVRRVLVVKFGTGFNSELWRYETKLHERARHVLGNIVNFKVNKL